MKQGTIVFAATLLASAIPVAAFGAVAVVGGGIAHSCYMTAEYGGDARTAVQTCTRALEQEALSVHDRASTLVNRGILRTRLGDLTVALADYDQALQIDSNLAEAYLDRGSAFIALHKYSDAVDSTNRAIELKPHEAQLAYYNRAVAEEALGNVKGAYEDLKYAVSIQPDFAAASEDLKRFRVVGRTDGA